MKSAPIPLISIMRKPLSIFTNTMRNIFWFAKMDKSTSNYYYLSFGSITVYAKFFIYLFLFARLHNIQNDELSQTIEELNEHTSIILNETLSNNVLLDLVSTKQRPRGSSVASFGMSTYGENPLLMYSDREYAFMKNTLVESKIPLPLGIGNIVSIQSCDDTT